MQGFAALLELAELELKHRMKAAHARASAGTDFCIGNKKGGSTCFAKEALLNLKTLQLDGCRRCDNHEQRPNLLLNFSVKNLKF